MSPRSRRIYAFLAVLASLALAPLVAFGADQIIQHGEVARNVTAAGIELGGLGPEDAAAAIGAYETLLATEPAVFVVDGTEFALDPARVGLDIDVDAVVASAMEQRRDTGWLDRLAGWFGSFRDPIEIDVPVTIEEAATLAVIGEWEATGIHDPAFDGGVVIADGVATADYPRPGRRIARSAAAEMIHGVLASPSRLPAELAVEPTIPTLTAADVDAAVAEANLLIAEPVILRALDIDVTFTADQLGRALVAELVTNSPTRLELSFSVPRIAGILTPHLSWLEQPPVDATFQVNDDDTVTIVPSRPATVVDPELVAAAVERAARSSSRTGELPLADGAPPAFSTADAEAMGPLGLVSEWTTKHPAGQPRVINIQTFADTVDGTVVWPGEEFSLNEHVGQRTTDKGYVPAPMIFDGELIDDVGGGVSQFATTFYNAVFFGCYEDVTHKPHSYYFSRYPEVREATISWPTPDLVFRNDSDAVIIIKTAYTSSSITVRFFGNNGGRTCESLLSGRYAFTDPPTRYEPDPTLHPGEQVETSKGAQGWSATNTRVITHPDGTVEEEEYRWAYSPQPIRVRVHPCEIPEGDDEHTGEPCPVEIPAVVGLALADATGALETLGFAVELGEEIAVDDEAQAGVVQAQSLAGWAVPAETTVVLQMGSYTPPPEPPPGDGDGGGEAP